MSRRTTDHVVTLVLVTMLLVAPAAAVQPEGGQSGNGGAIGNFDIRLFDRASLDRLVAVHGSSATVQRTRAERARAIETGLIKLRAAAPGAEVTSSALTTGAEIVKNDRGTLTASAPGRAGIDIVRDFLRAHQNVYGLGPAEINGLHFIGESRSRATGLRMVRVEQRINGLRVFQSETRFVLDRDGRLIRSVGLLVPAVLASAPSAKPTIGADDALTAAMQSVGIAIDRSRLSVEGTGSDVRVIVPDEPRIRDGVRSELAYFPMAPGVLVLAWSQVTFTRESGDWYTLTDAKTGALLWRKNIRAHASTQDARFSVYVQDDGVTPADSPAPRSPTPIVAPGSGAQFPAIARTIVSMLSAQDPDASPNGWIPDNATTTTGNNVDAYLDTTGDNRPDAGLLDENGRPTGNPDQAGRNRDFLGSAPRDFEYTPAPSGNDPDAGDAPSLPQFRRGAVTHAFYVANWFHDTLYQLGFDEAAGNFQSDNFGRGGLGSDPILLEIQDGSGINNAFFSPAPDGQPGRMQLFLWTGPSPDRDGALDADVMIHELTHGLSNRLVGNAAGLMWDVGVALGEGWSDFYAIALLNASASDDPNGRYAFGAYVTYKLNSLTDNYLYGIRRFPYSTNMVANPLTWADVDDVTASASGGIAPSPLNQSQNGALEPHNAGALWALSLWEVRSLVIAQSGGNVGAGNATMLGIVTDAMKLTPANPSFIEARDALFAADCAANACANEVPIWQGFAKRGLGFKAVAPLARVGALGIGAQIGIGESFALPALDVERVIVDDSVANDNNAIDPGERVSLIVRLSNPWRHAAMQATSVTARLSSSTRGVTVVRDTAVYPTIPAQGAVYGSPFVVLVDASVPCGQALRFTLETTSSIGTTTTDFVVRVGQASGTATPVVYTRAIPGGLPIPDRSFFGVTDTLTITDDLEIADVSLRVDNLTHTFTGDLTVMLKTPSGYGTDLIFRRGVLLGRGDGDNFVNTVIDDSASLDLNLTFPANAPFTASYTPAFNSVLWDILDIGADPVGQLSRLNGSSTLGDWKLHVTDVASLNTGRLNAWSLIVTPTRFTCDAPAPPASISLSSAVLPSSRSPQVGRVATTFATIVAAGSGTATDCRIVPTTDAPVFMSFQTTDPRTNALTGEPNTPVNIAANDFQTFVISVAPYAAFDPTDLALSFDCANTRPAPISVGLTTLLVSGSNGPVADVLAVAATSSNDGVVNIPGSAGTGAFAAAIFNVGASGVITASVDTGGVALPVSALVCRTDSQSNCTSSPSANVTTQVDAGQMLTFAIFAHGTGNIPFDPATHRLFLRLKDASNVTRGSTSVAVRTQ